MKKLTAILAFVMVISMITPTMAEGVSAYASGFAGAGSDGTYATTYAGVSYAGTLTAGNGGAMSQGMGDEYAESSSWAGGELYPGYSANIYAGTQADAGDAWTWAQANIEGYSTVSDVTLYTEVGVDAFAYGEEASSGAGVQTEANWDIPGIESTGYASAQATGSYVETGYDTNYAYAVSNVGDAVALGDVQASGENGANVWTYSDAWNDEYGNNALHMNWGEAWGYCCSDVSNVYASVMAGAYLED